jgi:hypothetical protein
MPTVAEFNKMFNIPREPMTQLGAGQYFELADPKIKKALITDVFIENMGGGTSMVSIQEKQPGINSFEVRYSYYTLANEHLVINYKTGLKLGDLFNIGGSIRVHNDGPASVLVRVNGVIVP